MIFYAENSKDCTNVLQEIISKFNNVTLEKYQLYFHLLLMNNWKIKVKIPFSKNIKI